MNKCLKCGGELLTGDVNGVCLKCRGETFGETSMQLHCSHLETQPIIVSVIKYDVKIEDDELVLQFDKFSHKEKIVIPLKDIIDYLKVSLK